MTSFATLLKGGESESVAIIPGKPEESYLVDVITPVDGAAEMPMDRKPLSGAEIETIVNWIRAGAVDDTPEGCGSFAKTKRARFFCTCRLPFRTFQSRSPRRLWPAT